jgi:hypothetical protein
MAPLTRIILAICLTAAAAGAATHLDAAIAGEPTLPEQVINGGAETGDLTGWSATGPQIAAVTEQVQSTGTVYPHTGSYFFTCADAAGQAVAMTQSGTLTVAEGTELRLAGYVQTEGGAGGDVGTATLRLFDAGDQLVAVATSEPLISDGAQWQPFAVDLEVPVAAGAQRWEIELSGTLVFGSFINVFYDAITLAEVPVATPDLAAAGGGLAVHAAPNPFNPVTMVTVDLARPAMVRLEVTDVRGRLVRVLILDERRPAGRHEVAWDGRDRTGRAVPSGPYLCRLAAGGRVAVARMALVR